MAHKVENIYYLAMYRKHLPTSYLIYQYEGTHTIIITLKYNYPNCFSK